MKSQDSFSSYHPALCFAFFIGAVVLGMCFRYPVHLVLGVVCASLYFLSLKGRRGLAYLGGLAGLFCFVTVLNPVLNPMGDTTLFEYFGRPFTMEALLYGLVVAAIFITIMLWFSCYNAVMTSDKFTYLFGGLAPAASLVFCMVLRLIPHYERRFDQMAAARAGIGCSLKRGSKKERVDSSVVQLSALISWALENAAVSADSMRARGYGCGLRSSYARYRFESRDVALLSFFVFCTLASALLYVLGGASMELIPSVQVSTMSPALAGSAVLYAALLLIPTIINVREALLWRFSLSKI